MKTIYVTLCAGALLLAAGCEPKPPKELTPEHTECLEEATAYLDCKAEEANEAGPAQKQIMRAVEANRRKAGISLEKCEAVLNNAPADDSCIPE